MTILLAASKNVTPRGGGRANSAFDDGHAATQQKSACADKFIKYDITFLDEAFGFWRRRYD